MARRGSRGAKPRSQKPQGLAPCPRVDARRDCGERGNHIKCLGHVKIKSVFFSLNMFLLALLKDSPRSMSSAKGAGFDRSHSACRVARASSCNSSKLNARGGDFDRSNSKEACRRDARASSGKNSVTQLARGGGGKLVRARTGFDRSGHLRWPRKRSLSPMRWARMQQREHGRGDGD